MKLTKRLLTAGMALGLALGLNVPAFAATITITHTQPGETYKAYKLFDVTYSDNDTPGIETDDKYSYSTTDTTLVTALEGIGLTFTTSADGNTYYVTTNAQNQFVTDTSIDTDGVMTAAELAEQLNTLVKSNPNPLGTPAATDTVATGAATVTLGDGTPTETDPELTDGYYFVTSTVGSLCYLQTNNAAIEIEEKNEAPTIEKTANVETASIGQTVDYDVTIIAQKGATNYVVHDTMSTGLTPVMDTTADPAELDVTVTLYKATGVNEVDQSITYNSGSPVAAGNWSVEMPGTEKEGDICTFELVFTQDFCNGLEANDKIVVEYSATVNENAVTVTPSNSVVLTYGNKSKTTTSTVTTYNYSFDLEKTDSKSGSTLSGAQFKLYDAAENGTAIQFVKTNDTTYRVATPAEIEEEKENAQKAQADGDKNYVPNVIDTITAGKVTIEGLDGKDYWLEETKAPDGYNKLDHRVQVEFITTQKDPDGGPDVDLTLAQAHLEDQTVANEAGSLLPSTGGMGTTILYIVGIVLVLGAGITLVVRRRMNQDR